MGCGASNRYRLPDYVIDTREVSGWLECMVSHTQRYLPSVEARLADGRLDESSRLVSERLERPIEGPMTVYRCAGKVTEMEILVHGLPYWATLRASYDPVGAPEFVLTCKNSDESTIELAASWEKTTGRPPPLCMEWEPQRKDAVPQVYLCTGLGEYKVMKSYYDLTFPETWRFADEAGTSVLAVFSYGTELEERVFHAFQGDVSNVGEAAQLTKNCVGMLEEKTGKLALRGQLTEPLVRLALAALLLRRLRLQWAVALGPGGSYM